ncbi:MAG TPA: ABC transporter permease [Alphaproteobacteria bacterium]|nr:ABC transporter permease [Alphaproteobacteria bacterium]
MTDSSALPAAGEASPAGTGFWRRARRHRAFMIGASLSGLMLASALVSLVWTPHSPTEIVVTAKLQPPSWQHWFGTDQFGRDILSMIMAGAQTSIIVGLIAVGLGLVFGVALGLLAAAQRGWVEDLVMRLNDLTFAFPVILVAILITAGWGPGIVNAILALGIFNVPIFARLVRGAAQSMWAREFVLAARTAGKGRFRITMEHILPNVLSVIVVQATISFAIAILAEAALSYLGVGSQPPEPSWGRMLSESQNYIFLRPTIAIWPGLAIAFSVLGLNLMGDGLRDLLDPRLSRQR